MSFSRIASLFALAFGWDSPSFNITYGSSPRPINGGTQSGAAAHKRAAKRRRNIRKNPRSAIGQH